MNIEDMNFEDDDLVDVVETPSTLEQIDAGTPATYSEEELESLKEPPKPVERPTDDALFKEWVKDSYFENMGLLKFGIKSTKMVGFGDKRRHAISQGFAHFLYKGKFVRIIIESSETTDGKSICTGFRDRIEIDNEITDGYGLRMLCEAKI
jgi:hypothetical protein